MHYGGWTCFTLRIPRTLRHSRVLGIHVCCLCGVLNKVDPKPSAPEAVSPLPRPLIRSNVAMEIVPIQAPLSRGACRPSSLFAVISRIHHHLVLMPDISHDDSALAGLTFWDWKPPGAPFGWGRRHELVNWHWHTCCWRSLANSTRGILANWNPTSGKESRIQLHHAQPFAPCRRTCRT